MNQSIEELKAKILVAQKSGDYLNEYDLARAAIKLAPDDEFFQYCAVLAFSRCNAKQRALDTFYSYKLHTSESEYIRALEARILKDLAFLSVDESTSPMSLDAGKFYAAARTYQKAFEQTGSHYSAINAATLYLLSGETELAHLLATAAIDLALKDGALPIFLSPRAPRRIYC